MPLTGLLPASHLADKGLAHVDQASNRFRLHAGLPDHNRGHDGLVVSLLP